MGAAVNLAEHLIAAEILGFERRGGAAVSSPVPGWSASGKSSDVAPLFGGRANAKPIPYRGVRTLAKLQKRADVTSPPATLTDVADAGAMYGTTELRFANSGFTALSLFPVAALTTPVDVTGGSIRIWVRAGPGMYSFLNRFELRLYSAGSPAAPSANYHGLDLHAVAGAAGLLASQSNSAWAPRWQPITIPVASLVGTGTGATLTAVTYASFHTASWDSGTGTFRMGVGSIEFVPNPRSKGAVIFTADDGYPSHYTYMAPKLAEYGWAGVAYVSAPDVVIGGTGMTVQQLKNLHDLFGWQIASQAWNNEQSTVWDAMSGPQRTEAWAKVRLMQTALGLYGGHDGSYFSNVTPSDNAVWNEVRQGFRSMRAYQGSPAALGSYPIAGGEPSPPGDPYLLRSIEGANGTFTSAGYAGTKSLKAHFDQAEATKGLAIVTYHNDLASAGAARNVFEAALADLDSRRDALEVLTLDQYVESLYAAAA